MNHLGIGNSVTIHMGFRSLMGYNCHRKNGERLFFQLKPVFTELELDEESNFLTPLRDEPGLFISEN